MPFGYTGKILLGYTGKILHVDLTHRRIETEAPDEVLDVADRPGQTAAVVLDEDVEIARVRVAHAVLEERALHREPGHLEREADGGAVVRFREFLDDVLPARRRQRSVVDLRDQRKCARQGAHEGVPC